jgi:hypothetical protein
MAVGRLEEASKIMVKLAETNGVKVGLKCLQCNFLVNKLECLSVASILSAVKYLGAILYCVLESKGVNNLVLLMLRQIS